MDTNHSRKRVGCPYRVNLALASSLVMLLFVVQASPGVNALNGGSCGGASPAIVARMLASTQLSDVPVDAVVAIDRLTFSPGATVSLPEGEGYAVYFVDSGSVAMRVEGKATVTRTVFTEATQSHESQVVSGSVDLRYSDSISVPPRVPVAIKNVTTLPAILLVATVAPELPGNSAMTTLSLGNGAERQLLASMLVSGITFAPASFSLVRVVYSAGATDSAATVNAGPLLIAVESGSLGYELTHGAAIVVRAEDGVQQPVAPGTEIVLTAKDYVAEQRGVVSQLRNPELDRTSFLIIMILPESDSVANYICIEK